MTGSPLRVSVVVPVYNPGPHIMSLIDSLLRQTMPASQFEAIFVDDGSTDETPALLDRVTAEHEHLRVIHQPNSGWPGKPRNVGIDAARGAYVFFSDHDDWFGDEALERLLDVAEQQHADVVIGKMVGHGRGVPRELFRQNRIPATFHNATLEDSLTPHKLFRKAFLDEHGIRFPEGKRRLEDHVFVMATYFAAGRICVVSDYDFYHHVRRPDERNAAYSGVDPFAYYGYVRETVEIVLTNTEPGPLRDRLMRRFLGNEVLGRLTGPAFVQTDADGRRAWFDAARGLVTELIPTSADARLGSRQRLQAQLLRAGNLAAVEELAVWRPTATGGVTWVGWEDTVIHVHFETALEGAVLRRAGDGALMLDRAGVSVDVTRDLERARVELIGVDRAKGETIVATTSTVRVLPDGRLVADGQATVRFADDPNSLALGTWWFRLRFRALGWVSDTAALPPTRHWQAVGSAFVGPDSVLVRQRRRGNRAVVDVAGGDEELDAAFALESSATSAPDAVQLTLPAAARGASQLEVLVGDRVATAELAPLSPGRSRATIRPTPAYGGAPAPLAVRTAATSGRWLDLELQLERTEVVATPTRAALARRLRRQRIKRLAGAPRRVTRRGLARAKQAAASAPALRRAYGRARRRPR